jgi:hypothetical protein
LWGFERRLAEALPDQNSAGEDDPLNCAFGCCTSFDSWNLAVVSRFSFHTQRERTMTAKTPPVPLENRSPKGTGDPKSAATQEKPEADLMSENADKRRQEANTRQNTTHQGNVQDR